jgi:hypothetical protein
MVKRESDEDEMATGTDRNITKNGDPVFVPAELIRQNY